MGLRDLQRHWDSFGKIDPFWSIITEADKIDGKWDPEQFFHTGRQYIDFVMASLSEFHTVVERQRALDFGCGAGRLAQGLCTYFEKVDGVDIAPSMVALARQWNRFGEQCSYHVNADDRMPLFADESFDLIVSHLVLQHIPPEYIRNYLISFLRLMRSGGILFFQLPSESKGEAARQPLDPLPPQGFRAKLAADAFPASLAAGRSFQVKIRVENAGTTFWRAMLPGSKGIIQVGNHWRDAHGSVILIDDGRVPLPRSLGPGDSAEVVLTIRAPLQAGKYYLEFDMVQENVCWFAERGSPTVRVPIQVTAESGTTAVGSPESLPQSSAEKRGSEGAIVVPRMEMNGIPCHEVIALLREHDGMIIDVREDVSAGEEWYSYRYCVRKK